MLSKLKGGNMKAFLFLGALMVSANAYAVVELPYYTCDGVGDVEEYSVSIDLPNGKASFFDNDSYSYLKFKNVLSLESNPPQRLLIFEGPEASYDGTLTIEFNQTRMKVSVVSKATDGTVMDLGEAKCKPVGGPIVED